MTPEQIQAFLDKLANALNDGAQYAFSVLIKQIVAESVVTIIASLFFMVATWAIAVRVARYVDRDDAKHVEDRNYYGKKRDPLGVWARFIGYGLAIFVSFFALVNIAWSFIALINPDYAAIERIIYLMK